MTQEFTPLSELIKNSFAKIAPFWPLQNIIAVNPLQGFEDLPIEEALKLGAAYFQIPDLPKELQIINSETIKWIQAYSDEGQAVFSMPLRQEGLYRAWKKLVLYDTKVHQNDPRVKTFLSTLPELPEQAIAECLGHLDVPRQDYEQFLTLLLTTLPGWAAHVKYRTQWATPHRHSHGLTQSDYLALRIALIAALWPQGKKILDWHSHALKNYPLKALNYLETAEKAEKAYRDLLLEKLAMQSIQPLHSPQAQLVFCIDIRSEPLRRAIELTGEYQTFGCGGFFGLPAQITNTVTGASYASCPALIQPKFNIKESPCSLHGIEQDKKGYQRLLTLI